MTNGPTRATVHPYRSSSCRNNLQQQVAPRCQGPWVPSLSRNGVLEGPWCNTHAGKRFSSGCQPGVRVVPFVRWPDLGSPPFGRIHHCQVAGGH